MAKHPFVQRNVRSGQVLIIALLILGVMLGLGLVFAGILGRNIKQTGTARNRTVASEASEAGIRYVHDQLRKSPSGADWRPTTVPIALDANGASRDPDALYLRQGTNLAFPSGQVDRGGPDGLGPFARVQFEKGRALIRVRYAPADWTLFDNPIGALRKPGQARNYTIIESVGRAGKVNPNDPTLSNTPITVGGFADGTVARNGINAAKAVDESLNPGSRKFMAFVSIGLTEQARFITNKFNSSVAAEIGTLSSSGAGEESIGATYGGIPVRITQELGALSVNSAASQIASGNLYCNADLVFHGLTNIYLNSDYGDGLLVAGTVRGANSDATLNLQVQKNGALTNTTLNGNSLDSRTSGFSTLNGVIRDGSQDADPQGYVRSIPRKEPPSILEADPVSGITRYVTLSRDSGRIVAGRNIGRFGYGEGVYVSAGSGERGDAQDEDERIQLGGSRSLVQDWLNPNKAASSKTGGWIGPYYVPLASYLRLLPNGFEITRDARSAQPRWRDAQGQDTTAYTARFRLVDLGVNGLFVINSILSPDLVSASVAQLSAQTARVQQEGAQFNGVIYFEGDVRVRGVIPTNQQVTVVSMGTIYIDGSITKGTVLESGAVLNTPSKSFCALLARDYVAVNTTQFFGPGPDQFIQAKDASALPDAPNPVEITTEGQASRLRLQTQYLLNPVTDALIGSDVNNPSTWQPFATTYQEAGSNAPLRTSLIMSHAADQDYSFLGINVQPKSFLGGTGVGSPFLFPSYVSQGALVPQSYNDGVRPYFLPAGTNPINVPIYGVQKKFPTFESVSFPLVDNTWAVTGARSMSGAGKTLALQDETEFDLGLDGISGLASSNYVLARAAVVPHDIRIEALIYAEEGSFFVIPGAPYNFKVGDTRQEFAANVASTSLVVAQQKRFEDYGSTPETPFFGEPVPVKISIVGAISENMPAPISMAAQWQRQWGWLPRELSGTGRLIPRQWVPASTNINVAGAVVPNLTLTYDSTLGTASASTAVVDPVRTAQGGLWILPPAPRLPVSKQLAYFGEVTP